MLKKALPLAFAAAVLASCGDSGPSNDDIAEAMNKALAELMGPDAKVEVTEAKCTESANDTYVCATTFRMPAVGTETQTEDVKLAKQDGEWVALPE